MTLIIILLTLLGTIAILQGMRINYLETHYVSAEDLVEILQSFHDTLEELLPGIEDEENIS